MTRRPLSAKAESFSESVIREMTRLAVAHHAVNLAQGFPDFPAPAEIKAAAAAAIHGDINQYAITWGAPDFRRAIAAKTARFLGVDVDPDTEITVCCGATEGMIDALLSVVDPGEEVVVFEPFYENYGPDVVICGARPRYVALHPPDWHIDTDELAAAFGPSTRAVILNTPNNPTGKVFTRSEIEAIGALCEAHDAYLVTDDIYEHITYDGHAHVSPLQMEAVRPRVIAVNSMSKTYSVTGWRVGWIIAAPEVTAGIRKMHDFITVGAAAPLQAAGVVALGLPDEYYDALRRDYEDRRRRMLDIVAPLPLEATVPAGAYYVMADATALGFDDDVACARYLVEEVGVATVPGSSFYASSDDGRRFVRFCFCKTEATLAAAAERLARLAP